MKKALILILAVAVLLTFAVVSFGGDHAAVGPEKCKMCHKVQYESWAATKHAAQNPKVDCEHCHGNGGDYWKPAVMKDPAAAKAAGLIMPTKADCAKCHGQGKVPAMTDAMFAAVHAHKAK